MGRNIFMNFKKSIDKIKYKCYNIIKVKEKEKGK